VRFERHEVSYLRLADVPAALDHFAGALVPEDQGRFDTRLRPRVPVVDVQIGAANSGGEHLHQHVVGANSGDWHVHEFRTRPRTSFTQGAHSLRHLLSSSMSVATAL
jgi:hypothetical protein